MSYPYAGDWMLDPPEDDDPDDCLTEAERRQQEFDDCDPED